MKEALKEDPGFFTLLGAATFLAFMLFATACTTTNPAPPPPVVTDPPAVEWFCKTIAAVEPGQEPGAPHDRAVAFPDRFWETGHVFKIGVMGAATTAQTDLVKAACAEWQLYAYVIFTFPKSGPYDIRVAFNPNDGAWSYIGTDCKGIPAKEPTMNLGWLARDAYLHEFGHTLGLLHEHQGPVDPIKWNEANVIKDLSGPPNNWSVATIRSNVLTTYPAGSVIATKLDTKSIMMYPIPGSWKVDGIAIAGGKELSDVDKAAIAKFYPGSAPPPPPPSVTGITLRKGQVDTLTAQIAALAATSKKYFGK